MKKIPNFTSTGFGLIDIGAGRNALYRRQGHGTREFDRIPVVIHAYLTHALGHDDGVSREFALDVQKVQVVEELDVSRI